MTPNEHKQVEILIKEALEHCSRNSVLPAIDVLDKALGILEPSSTKTPVKDTNMCPECGGTRISPKYIPLYDPPDYRNLCRHYFHRYI